MDDPIQAYELACEMRAYELSQTIARNNFFMVFQGVVLAGALGLASSEPSDRSNWLWIAVSILGISLSVLQFMMATAGRNQIIFTTRLAVARELDVLAAIPPGVTRYHFHTEARGTHNASNSLVCYDAVKPRWKMAGLKRKPQPTNSNIEDECSFIARSILKRRQPSVIAIWVALALIYFWIAVLVLQFVELGPVPKLILG